MSARGLHAVRPAEIRLVEVSKAFAAGSAPRIVLRPTSAGWRADRRVAVLGAKRSGKTTVLQMLSGKLAPDGGEVLAPLAFSPVVNAGGFLHPQLTGLENIRFIARAFGVDADRLAAAAAAFADGALHLADPIRARDAAHRKTFEAAVAMTLPFGCCLIDDAAQLAPELLARCFAAAEERGAGLVFATANPRLAREADEVAVIADATLRLFAEADEAVRFFEQHGR